MTDETTYMSLRQLVERTSRIEPLTPTDFDRLAKSIDSLTHRYISPTTLKRFWGYLPTNNEFIPRRYSLDTLAIYVGHKDWNSFISNIEAGGDSQSNFINDRRLHSADIVEGQLIRVIWDPDREITIKHLGDGTFTITECRNSKLRLGDSFRCSALIANEPLYLTALCRDGKDLGDYVCGRVSGIAFTVI